MVYNGIAYSLKWFAQRTSFSREVFNKAHASRDVDTSWWRRGDSITSWMNDICCLQIYSPLSRVCYSVLQKSLHCIPASTLCCCAAGHWRALDCFSWRNGQSSYIWQLNKDFHMQQVTVPPAKLVLGHLIFVLPFAGKCFIGNQLYKEADGIMLGSGA